MILFLFFFNDTATTEIYTLSLHDALPISRRRSLSPGIAIASKKFAAHARWSSTGACRSEEHTSELQSRPHLVCRLLLEKKKKAMGGAGEILGRAHCEREDIPGGAHSVRVP